MKTIIMFVASAFLVAAGCSMFSSHDSEMRELIFSGAIAVNPETGIYTIDLDGSGLEKVLVSSVESYFSVSLSPDRTRLVFLSSLDATTVGPLLYTATPDGSGMRLLSTVMNRSTMIVGAYPRWSTNSELVFTHLVQGELFRKDSYGFVADLEAGAVTQLDIGPVALVEPGPEGMYAFLQRNAVYYEVFMYREGGEIRQLTSTGGSVVFGLDWSPNFTKIVFLERARDIVVIDTLGNELSRRTLVPDSLQQYIMILGDLEWLPGGQTILANRRDSRIERDTRYSLVAIDLSDNSIRSIISGRKSFETTWAGGF